MLTLNVLQWSKWPQWQKTAKWPLLKPKKPNFGARFSKKHKRPVSFLDIEIQNIHSKQISIFQIQNIQFLKEAVSPTP